MKKEVLAILVLFSSQTHADIHEYIERLKEHKHSGDLNLAVERIQIQILANLQENSIIEEQIDIGLGSDNALNLDIEGEDLFNRLFSEDFIEKLNSEATTETGDTPCGVIKH